MNLCCLVNPQYKCFCGFQECRDCWERTRDKGSCHFNGRDGNWCTVTQKQTKSFYRMENGVYCWDEKSEIT